MAKGGYFIIGYPPIKPDDDPFDIQAVVDSIQASGGEVAYILHDKDVKEDGTLKEPHYHIYACQNGGVCATSQHFNISIKIGDYNDINSNPGQPIVPSFSLDSSDSRAGVRWDYSSTWRRSLYAYDSLGFFSDYFRNMDISPNVIYGAYIYTAPNSSIPVLTRGSSLSYLTLVGAQGVSVTLPEYTVNTVSPWNYYNNTLLPYIKQTFNDIDNIENYLVFPNGYYPSISPDPTEPATFPNGGVWIGDNYDIDINFVTVTDSSGQPITDSQGETITETQIVSDTRSTDAVYKFEIPTIERLNIYSATVPSPDLSQFSDGLSFIWTATEGILNDSGFMPVIVIVLTLSVIGFALWKLGG